MKQVFTRCQVCVCPGFLPVFSIKAYAGLCDDRLAQLDKEWRQELKLTSIS